MRNTAYAATYLPSRGNQEIVEGLRIPCHATTDSRYEQQRLNSGWMQIVKLPRIDLLARVTLL
jgi:hypothetical protein